MNFRFGVLYNTMVQNVDCFIIFGPVGKSFSTSPFIRQIPVIYEYVTLLHWLNRKGKKPTDVSNLLFFEFGIKLFAFVINL